MPTQEDDSIESWSGGREREHYGRDAEKAKNIIGMMMYWSIIQVGQSTSKHGVILSLRALWVSLP